MLQAPTPSQLAPPEQLTCDHQIDPLAVVSKHPVFGWVLSATNAQARGVRQSAWRILVSSSRENLRDNNGDLWDSGRIVSSETLNIPYDGKPLAPQQLLFWKVEVWDDQAATSGWSALAKWTMAPAHIAAQWIAESPATSLRDGTDEGGTRPMPVFRKQFAIDKPVERALLYVSGLGQYEAHINGKKVGDRELTPGWTDYRRRVLYDTYDVTALMHQGENAIGVLLGNGMFNVAQTQGRYTKFVGTFGEPRLLMELHLRLRDGTSQIIATGPGWQTSAGPIIFSSTYGGEDYDARAVPAEWDLPGALHGAGWRSAVVVHGPGGTLNPEVTAPLKVMQVYRPVSEKKLTSGAEVYDLGQNFAGWPAITVEGHAGAQIKLISGELLRADGSVTQHSANAEPLIRAQSYTYTLRGQGVEAWHPRFSYWGFRYVQVEVTGEARVLSLEGEAVHSSALETGTFDSSVALLNRIHTLILRAMENNMESVLTDCPHREKLGWLEQTHLMGSALNYDFDLQRLYNKIEDDMADAQLPSGLVPSIAPEYTIFGNPRNDFDDSPEWGSAIVLAPWISYQRYGDLEELRSHFADMRRYVDYLTSRSVNGIVDYGLGDWYDIGPKPPGPSQLTSRGLTATAIYYQDIVALERTARLLRDGEAERKMAALRSSVGKAFQQRFYHPEQHSYDRGSQTANAMPLVLGLVPPHDRTAVLQQLIADIRAHQNHVTAGDVGFHYVVDALQDNHASNVLLDMLLRSDPPSYGYQLRQGATSLTEAWDANPDSSQDHLMLGHAEEWFYAGMAGIRIDFTKGATHPIVIEPAMLRRVDSADVSYRSVRGVIHVGWKHAQQHTAMDVTIPPNCSAMVVLPAMTEQLLREGGVPASRAPAVTFVRADNESLVLSIESGHYHFSFPTPQGDAAAEK
jgi:alpha-L-rhamnosidase